MNGHWNTVPGIVRCHKCHGSSFGYAFIKRVRIVFMKQPLIVIGRCGIPSVFVAVGQKMLHKRSAFPVPRVFSLQSFYKGNGHSCSQESIFSKTFLGSAPSRIPGQIGIRGPHDHSPFVQGRILRVVSHFCGLNIGNLFQQPGIPGGSQTIGLRKSSCRVGDRYPLAVLHFPAAPASGPSQGHTVKAFGMTCTADSQARYTQICREQPYFFFQGKQIQKIVNSFVVGTV